MPSDVEFAYAAGYIDGDGTISIQRSEAKGHVHYSVRVTAASTDKDVILWMQEHFGGNLYLDKVNSAVKKHKRVHLWSLNSKNLKPFLTGIYPYLVVKQLQCGVALEFLEHAEEVGHPGVRGHTEETKSFRKFLYNEILLLNRRGI